MQASTQNTSGSVTGKLERAMGGLNIALGAVLLVDGIILAIVAFCCLLMSFSLFFMAAIPAFLVIGFLCMLAFGGAAVNIVTGAGTVLSSSKQGKLPKVLSVVTLVVDVVVIPANIIALVCGTYLLYTEVNFLSIIVFVVAAGAIMLAVASLVLSAIGISKKKKSEL